MNNKLVVNISKFVLCMSLIIIGVMALVFKNSKPIILGYIFGTTINILCLSLINNSTNRALTMPPSKAQKYFFSNYIVRITIYLAVLTISHKADYLNIFATFIGLNMVKLAIYLMTFFNKEL